MLQDADGGLSVAAISTGIIACSWRHGIRDNVGWSGPLLLGSLLLVHSFVWNARSVVRWRRLIRRMVFVRWGLRWV